MPLLYTNLEILANIKKRRTSRETKSIDARCGDGYAKFQFNWNPKPCELLLAGAACGGEEAPPRKSGKTAEPHNSHFAKQNAPQDPHYQIEIIVLACRKPLQIQSYMYFQRNPAGVKIG